MCRLFGLHAGAVAIAATFWLLDAPDSLAAQSHRNPDGAGIGVFEADGTARVDKQPIAAWDDTDFASGARELAGTTFVAHVRHASTGEHTTANTHPFEQDRRLFAHNGVVDGLDELDARLAELGASGLVHGQTDSERVFALITAESASRGGDVTAGLTAALAWISDPLPVYSVKPRVGRRRPTCGHCAIRRPMNCGCWKGGPAARAHRGVWKRARTASMPAARGSPSTPA